MSIHDVKSGSQGNYSLPQNALPKQSFRKKNVELPPPPRRKKARIVSTLPPSVEDGIEQQVEPGGTLPESMVGVPDPILPRVNPEKLKKQIRVHDLNGKMLHIKVGDPSWKDMNMLDAEIGKVEQQITELIEDNDVDCMVFVTHYGVDVKIIESSK